MGCDIMQCNETLLEFEQLIENGEKKIGKALCVLAWIWVLPTLFWQ